MAAAVFPIFQKPAPDLDRAEISGVILAEALEKLDAAAIACAMKPLGDFMTAEPADYVRAMRAEEPLPEHVGLEHPPEVEWFDAEKGLETLGFLLGYVRERPSEFEDHELLIKDLLDFERLLSKAAGHGIRWRLEREE